MKKKIIVLLSFYLFLIVIFIDFNKQMIAFAEEFKYPDDSLIYEDVILDDSFSFNIYGKYFVIDYYDYYGNFIITKTYNENNYYDYSDYSKVDSISIHLDGFGINKWRVKNLKYNYGNLYEMSLYASNFNYDNPTDITVSRGTPGKFNVSYDADKVKEISWYLKRYNAIDFSDEEFRMNVLDAFKNSYSVTDDVVYCDYRCYSDAIELNDLNEDDVFYYRMNGELKSIKFGKHDAFSLYFDSHPYGSDDSQLIKNSDSYRIFHDEQGGVQLSDFRLEKSNHLDLNEHTDTLVIGPESEYYVDGNEFLCRIKFDNGEYIDTDFAALRIKDKDKKNDLLSIVNPTTYSTLIIIILFFVIISLFFGLVIITKKKNSDSIS